MEGLPLTSDGAYEKHDAKFVSYFTSLSCPSLALPQAAKLLYKIVRRTNREVTSTLTLAFLPYTSEKKDYFQN